jgi:hypothetical protein
MHTEIVKQINDLPVPERIEIIEKVSRRVRQDLEIAAEENGDREAIIARRRAAVDRLRGIAAVPGKTPPTDEEWREERTNYLLEKYK